ncbi:amidase [Telmatospirillum sp.]|uniref:amidase n=1 Tax=Telmatospirillum sp. TaxID=2079197 RepID=UPI00283D7C58|nr:amidase [Telmatospirillum sp.]MDR3440394.1 amidase [Telmatospirillum sp.]
MKFTIAQASSVDVTRRSLLIGAAGGAVTAMAASLPKTAFAAPSEIVMMDALTLAKSIRSREVSCVEVMTAYLDHIEKFNPKVNAIVALQERADLLAQAGERDRQIARGEVMGPLHGFPHAVKDLAAVKGIRTTMGSPIFKDFVPKADSIMVDRLRKAGAIFIGKTNTPEFGLGSQTYNQVYGATRNAYDQTRTSGGSSGGAAVSLALRMLPVADGSDYAGSLRNPAGWNNVFGFRTSYGRVPADARDVWLPSMGVIGPMARSVPDLAMLLSVQAGYDSRVPLSIEGTGADFAGSLQADFKGKKIAWTGDFNGYLPFEPGVLDVCKQALKVFESMGCIVEEAVPDYPVDAVWRAWLKLRAWQNGSALLAYYNDPAKRALLKPEAVFEVENGMKLSAYDISAASVVRSDWTQAVRRLFETYDFLIAPTAQVFPFDAGLHWPQEIAGKKMETYHEWMKGVLPFTMSGCPALAAPAGFGAHGLPMGIQIVGPNHAEMACLQLAYAYDAANGWAASRLPPLLSGV